MSKKIYLSPERRPAPHGPYFGHPGVWEHDVTVRIAEKTAAALRRCGYAVRIAAAEDPLRQRVAEGIAWGADYYLPIHTNASSSTTAEGKAQGPEVLAYGAPGGVSWRACQMTYDALMELYPRKTARGVRQNTTFYEINKTPMLSVYPELAFHDNGADADWLLRNEGPIAEALTRAVCRWFGTGYRPPQESAAETAESAARRAALEADRDRWQGLYRSLKEQITALAASLE